MVDGSPTHTPYDGSSRLFTAGLTQLHLDDWIETDAGLPAFLAEKARLYREIPQEVHVEEAGTLDAQREVLALLKGHLPVRFPEIYRRSVDEIEITGSGAVSVGTDVVQPLRAASTLVAEDLILMRRDGTGWRLVAGSLCFPSSWSLREKFGRPMHEIHGPVPGFGPGTRMADIINRMFDSLKIEQPMQRFNWSLQAGDALYHPLSNDERDIRAMERPSKFAGDGIARAFIRVERQTLRKLPVSRDILFTIRIHLDPLAVLERHPDRAALAASFAGQIAALDEAQLDYKGLTADRDRLVAILQEMGRS